MATTYLREDEVFGTKPAPQYLSEDEVFGKPVAEAAPAPVAPTRPTVTPVTLPSAPVAEPLSLSPEEPQVVTEAERAPVVEPIAAARPTPRPARRPVAQPPQVGGGRGQIIPPLALEQQPDYTVARTPPVAKPEPIEAAIPSGLSGEFAGAAEAIAGEQIPVPQPERGFFSALPTEDRYVVNPAFIDAVQKQLDVMPEDQRKDALDKLAKRTDVYGRAAKVIQGRYAQLDKITSPTIKERFDPRLEVQTERYIKQGANADVAESIAKQRGRTIGIGRDLQQLTRDIPGEQAAAEAERVSQEMKDAGFLTRVGAETASRLRQSALGAARIYADVIDDKDLQNDLRRYSQIETARGEAIPKGESIAARSAQQAIATLTQQAPMIILGAMTGTALPVLGQAAFDSFTQSYNESRNAGKNAAEAATRAGMMATAEVFFERYGLTDQFKAIRGAVDRIPANKLSGYLASAFIKEIPAEQATTLTQFLTDKLPQIGLNPNAGLQGYLEQAGETLRQTVLQSGAQSAIVYGAGAAARRLGKPEEPTRPRVEPTGPDVTLPTEERLEPAGELPQAGPTAEIPLGEEISVPGRPEPTLTFEPLAEVPGRIEPTLEGVPLAPTLRSRGAQPERLAPEEVETVPGMPTADVLAEEPRVTPVTPAPVSLEPIEPSAVMPPDTVTPVTPAAEAPEAAPGNQPRIGDAFDPTGWTEQENKINKKTGQPSLTEGRVRYKRTDDRGFEQTVIVQNGQVSTSNSVSPVIELTNSHLDFDAPVKGRIIVLNSDVQGIVLTFVPEDSSGAAATGMSPRAVQQYKAGVPIEKIAETEFSDAGGIMPDGTRTPHTTVGRLVAAPKKTVTPVTPGEEIRRLALEEQTKAGWNQDWPFIPADLTNPDFRQLIKDDPDLTQEVKQQIFDSGKKLGVVPESETVTPVTPEAEAPAPPPAVTPVTPKKVAKPKVEAVELPQAVQELDEPVREQFQKLVELARLYDFKPGGQEPNWNLAVKSYKDTLATKGEQGVVDLFANTEKRIRDEGGRAVVDKANQAYADKFGGLFPTPPVLKNAVKTGAFDISDQPWANAYYDLAGIDPTKIVKAEEPKDAVAEHVARFNAGQYRISTSTNIKGQTVKMSEESYVPAVRQFLEGPLTAKPPTGKQDGLDFDAIRQLSDVDPMPVEIKGKPGTAKDYLGYIKALYALTPKDDVRYYLKGVYLDPKTDRLAVTDGHRLVIVNNAGSKGKVPERPAKGVTSTDDIILGPDGQWGKIGDNLISGKFPNIDKVTPKAEDQTAPVTFNTEEFLGKARAVEKGDKYFKTKYPLALAVQVENRQFSFNPQYLADMAEVFRKMGYETFNVSLPKGKGALLATSPDGKVQQVVMPMREGDDDGKIVPMFWKPLGSKAAAPKVEKLAEEAPPSAEYQAALDRFRVAAREFKNAQEAYRKQEIGDEEFLTARKVFDKETELMDAATAKEQGVAKAPAKKRAPKPVKAVAPAAPEKAVKKERPRKPPKPVGEATEEQVKEEAKYVEQTVHKALEEIQKDFMVGDLVRFGNTPGVVIGLEGDYVRFRPDSARSPKAYQRVPKKSLTRVSRPDTTSEVSYSKAHDNKFGEEAGQFNADKANLIRLLGANMYQSALADVAIKELLQNAFDAVKGATSSVNAEGQKITPLYKSGTIEITINAQDRTISFKDDARGMTPDIVRKAFFTIAGSEKSDLPPEMRSGGLGLAKMGFMLGSERLQLDTVRDGVRVTVDAAASDIATDNFKIVKAPAPKGEHGTTVTVKIPETYIDPKTGDPKSIFFPYSMRSIEAFNKPLIGPVEVKATFTNFGKPETVVLPVGVNFPADKFTKFKANFEWGSADIYFSIDRNTGSTWDIKHQVLSSGVYQFSPDFTLNNEKIPFDIIVDVKPNVDARHPDYPFENSRERFKGRLDKDVQALTMYLGQIARGYEARDLQDSFKGVVSMPRVEVGAEIAGMAEKLKKTFGSQAAAKPTELKPLPKEVTVTADTVRDTKTQQVLVDVKAKEAEKQKEATFKGEAVPKGLDFMIEMKQDPKLPVFHNNTNLDYMEIGKPYGEPEKFFAELGTLVVEMKEELAKSGMFGYDKLSPENLFFAGVSIDKGYGGVHIKVPYKAIFINPFYSFGARTLFGARQQLLNTMIHEIAHTGSMDHGVAHNTNMVKVEQYLADEGMLDYYRDALLDILRRHESVFTAMREAYGKSTTRNTAKSLEDYGKDAAAASSRGDRGRVEYAPSALSARGRPEGGAGIPEAKAAGRKGEISGRPGETRGVEEAVQPSFEFDTEITDQVANANPVVAQALSKADELPKAKKKLPPGRSPELAAAAEQVLKGTMTKEEFDGLVNRYKPIPVYAEPLMPATSEQVYNSLDVLKREKINPQISTGYPVGLRLDIPAFNRHGVFVVTIHEKRTPSSPGEAIGYTSVASIKNVKFGVGNQKATLQIAAGKAKDAIQTMEGEYVPITPEEAYRRAKDVFDGWVQVGIDPTRHAYFYDRRTTQPVLAADEVIQIGNMILARGVTYGSKADFLFNIDSGPGDIKLDRDEIRKQQIQNYANLRSKLTRAVKKVAEGEMDISMQRNLSETMQAVRDLQAEIKATKPRRDSAERFMARALQEYDDGNISADVLAVIQSAYNKSPELLEGLLLSVKTDKARPFTSGSFEALRRVITLYKGTSGITNPSTIRHELTHALEQMMTPEQASVVVQAWAKALQRAINQNPDELHQRYFNAVLNFIENPNERTARLARKALPSYEMYQFINPSEFWAVNGEPLMASELGGAWDKFKKAVRKLFEGLKNVFGFDNRYAVHKIFDQIMKGDKKRMSHMTLIDFVSTAEGPPFTTLENIDEDQDLMKKYNRPHTPMLDTNPLKTFITRQFKNGKEFIQAAVENPLATMTGAGKSVIDGLINLRNKNVWYGSGLESRDFDQYNGELKTSEGMSTASVALDNAIRSGNIGVEVIFRGGIKFDSKSNNFVAVEREKGMKGVYEAEAAIKKRLGDQLGTDIVQGYLEAKRSISIMNELYEREADLEAAKENLAALKKSGADPGLIEEAEAIKDKATKDLDSINKAVSSVNMSEEEMEEFAGLDERHPELRDLMNNWTAINQNLLRFWRQVGLLSEARYESLAKIKDYVPWYRIMNDELDLHDSDQSAIQSTTRSMTNIGVEKLFKRGKPISVVDFRAEEGQKDFKIQPSSVVKVKVNGKVVNPDLISVTPSGDVRIDMDLRANDLVVFETNREIQNIIDNMTRNVMRMTMNGIRQYAANRIVLEYASRNEKGKIMVFPSVDKDKGRFNWVVDGKKVVVEISDPLVAASIYGMENLNLQMWRPLAAVANLTRRTITLSGVFQVKQVFKDAPTAAIVTGVKNPLALIGGVWKGFLTSLIQPAVKKAGVDVEPVVEILKAAGIGGYMSPARTPEAEIKRRLGIMNRNVFSAVIKGLDHIGDASDMAQRVATYKRVLAETGNETQALYQAANVINFLHHGSAGYAQAAVKVVPFLGAYANATDVLFRSLMGSGLKGVDRKKALARLAVTGTMLASLAILYAMLASTDPDYDELDDDTKLKNIIIPGTKIMLPMNTSAALFFKAIPELIYNKVTREGTENEYDARRLRTALGRVARDMLLGPEPIPAGVKPVLEVAINYNFFTGRTVIPEGLKDVEAAKQYTATTSELGKKISEMMPIPGTDDKRVLSPIEADHLVRGIFGTAGAMAQWVSNSLGTLAETRPEPTAKETPITGSFLRDEIPRGREDLFYDFKDIVFEKYKTWKRMVDLEDYEAADAYIEKHGDVAAMYEYINDTESDLKEINTEIRRLGETRSKDQSPRERREEIDELKRVKQDILEPVKELRREVLK